MSQPQWLQSLANSAAVHITPVDMLPPLGCHVCEADGRWEVTVFASATEIVGGPRDGSRFPSKFLCDVKGILDLFESVDDIRWQPMPVGSDDELGAHLSVEGTYEGQPVCLRILARSPRRFPPGRIARVYDMSWEEVW